MQTAVLQTNGSHIRNGLAVFFEDKENITARINESLQLIGNAPLREAAAHLFVAGGKMLRSSLVATSYKAVGGKEANKILSVAAAVELIHNWSLVHDDIIDRSLTRRGVPTVHEKWDVNTAILTGDVMSNLVYLLILKSGFQAEAIARVMECVAEASMALIEGEWMDVEFGKRKDVKESDYFEMINRKTGALIYSAAKTGALLGTDHPHLINALETYGEKIGIAFQIKDDLLDLTGDEAETGKDFAGDIKEGKKTVMLLHALCNAVPARARRLAEIISGGAVTADDVLEAIEVMHQAGSFEYAQNILSRLISEAKQSLTILPPSQYVTALNDLADFIGQPEMIKVEYPLYTI